MLSGVGPMQTGARCARNHRKPGISAACVPARSPSPHSQPRADIRQESYGAHPLCARQTDRLHKWAKVARTSKLQSNRKEEGGVEGPHYLSLRILLHCHSSGM